MALLGAVTQIMALTATRSDLWTKANMKQEEKSESQTGGSPDPKLRSCVSLPGHGVTETRRTSHPIVLSGPPTEMKHERLALRPRVI